MRIASLNTNKRLGSTPARTSVEQWLHSQHVDLLVTQEAWKPADREPPELLGFRGLGGSHQGFAWIRDDLPSPAIRVNEPHWITLRFPTLTLHSVYLDAYKQTTRAAQIEDIRHRLASGTGPTIIVGDFNIAPTPDDGLTNGEPSRFNSDTDRGPLHALLRDLDLVDLGAGDPVHFTIERSTKRGITQFRCDLALSTSGLSSSIRFRPDDRPRTDRFSDHSALVIDIESLPASTTAPPVQPTQLSLLSEPAIPRIAAHKTAMGRPGPSAPAVRIAQPLIRAFAFRSVLDFGCGRGRDIAFYRDDLGLESRGYDPHIPFGFAELPNRLFDLVTVVFVLNVIPNHDARIEAIRTASRYLKPDGLMLIVTRSSAEIASHARKRQWEQWGDGFISDPRKQTFQKGFTPDQLRDVGEEAGLDAAVPQLPDLPTLPQASYAILKKRHTGSGDTA